jgi:hypothetical protein
LFTIPERWYLAFLDFSYDHFNKDLLFNNTINLLKLDKQMCCHFQSNCSCDEKLQHKLLQKVVTILGGILEAIYQQGVTIPTHTVCNVTQEGYSLVNIFKGAIEETFKDDPIINLDDMHFSLRALGIVEVGLNVVAKLGSDQTLVVEDGKEVKPVKPFYRIGTTHVSGLNVLSYSELFCEFSGPTMVLSRSRWNG